MAVDETGTATMIRLNHLKDVLIGITQDTGRC